MASVFNNIPFMYWFHATILENLMQIYGTTKETQF